MREVGYNSQRDNDTFGNKFFGWQQCFSTSAWMLLSWYAPEKYRHDDDEGLKLYVDDVCSVVGEKGTAEDVMKNNHDISGNSAYYWVVQQAGVEIWMKKAGKIGIAKYYDGRGTWEKLKERVKISPVILGTKLTTAGHIILVVDYDENRDIYICNDPYGDANTGYSNKNGKSVEYRANYLKANCPDGLRFMYFREDHHE